MISNLLKQHDFSKAAKLMLNKGCKMLESIFIFAGNPKKTVKRCLSFSLVMRILVKTSFCLIELAALDKIVWTHNVLICIFKLFKNNFKVCQLILNEWSTFSSMFGGICQQNCLGDVDFQSCLGV